MCPLTSHLTARLAMFGAGLREGRHQQCYTPPPRNSEPPPEMVGGFSFWHTRNAKEHGRSEIVRALKCTYNVQTNFLRFEWDDHKATANLKKHGISFDEAKSAFYDERAKLIDDPDHSEDEDRFILLGLSHSLRVVVVCHCYRGNGDVIRIISARKATTRESKADK